MTLEEFMIALTVQLVKSGDDDIIERVHFAAAIVLATPHTAAPQPLTDNGELAEVLIKGAVNPTDGMLAEGEVRGVAGEPFPTEFEE